METMLNKGFFLKGLYELMIVDIRRLEFQLNNIFYTIFLSPQSWVSRVKNPYENIGIT